MSNIIKPAFLRLAALTLLVAGVTGCGSSRPLNMDDPAYAPRYPLVKTVAAPTQGSLFSAGAYVGLFTDAVASRVGDILTIRLSERTISKKSSSSTISKASDATLQEPVLLGALVRGLDVNGGNLNAMGSSNDFSGSADSDQSNSLQGNISVTIAEILPNGSFVVRGEKWMKLNQGDEFIRISGIVRAADIDATNGVDSNKIADARITYGGKGAGANANAPGWLSRFFINPFFPY
jgi:flagellar L-ring protein precursor FlgH